MNQDIHPLMEDGEPMDDLLDDLEFQEELDYDVLASKPCNTEFYQLDKSKKNEDKYILRNSEKRTSSMDYQPPCAEKRDSDDRKMTQNNQGIYDVLSNCSSDDQILYNYQLLYKRKTFVPPLNFSVVEDGLYRSGHPIPINYDFLQKLNLRTIIYLGDKEDQLDYYKWIYNSDIKFYYIKTKSSKEPFVMNNPNSYLSSLQLILDSRNFPILIHSNKGKHRVGVLVGIMRKFLQGWSLTGIFDEYVKFAGGKGEADLEFMEIFNPTLTVNIEHKPDFVRMQ